MLPGYSGSICWTSQFVYAYLRRHCPAARAVRPVRGFRILSDQVGYHGATYIAYLQGPWTAAKTKLYSKGYIHTALAKIAVVELCVEKYLDPCSDHGPGHG